MVTRLRWMRIACLTPRVPLRFQPRRRTGRAPVLAANQVPIFECGCIRGSITKNVFSTCPYSERAPATQAGTPKRTCVLCDFTSENKEEKTNCHLNSNCRPFLRFVYARFHRKSQRISLVFTGISRVLIPNTGTVHLQKKMFLVGVWRVYLFHHSQKPIPWFAAGGCILGKRRGWGYSHSHRPSVVRRRCKRRYAPADAGRRQPRCEDRRGLDIADRAPRAAVVHRRAETGVEQSANAVACVRGENRYVTRGFTSAIARQDRAVRRVCRVPGAWRTYKITPKRWI